MSDQIRFTEDQVISLRATIPTLRGIDKKVLEGELLFLSAKEDGVVRLNDDDFKKYRNSGNAYQAVSNKWYAKEQTSIASKYLGVDIPEGSYGIVEVETVYGEKTSVIMFRDDTGLFIKPFLLSEEHSVPRQIEKLGFKKIDTPTRGDGVLYFVGREQQARWEIMLAKHKIRQVQERVKLNVPVQPHRSYIKAIHQLHRNEGVVKK